nr:hypothetical protein [Tanacetum cinerariifolium]
LVLAKSNSNYQAFNVKSLFGEIDCPKKSQVKLKESFLNDDPSLPLPNQGNYLPEVRKELKISEAKSNKSSIDEPLEVELKNIPPHLEYVFLEGDDKFPVIIAKDLSVEEKTALITVLKSHKRAITWKLSDINGIDPEFCTHKILIEEDFEPAVQHQIRVNSKIHDVVKQEVIKLFDAGLIYPISDSPWVSPVHCVPKKGSFTVVENEDNELILTRLVTGWRACINYRKLNETTRKDHFPLPFMDKMVERLAGNHYYCFLDDFSERMLKRCEDTNHCLNWEKTHFMVKEGLVLGHKIFKQWIGVDKAKVDVITKLPHPTTVKGVRSFLECVEAFQTLKRKLTEDPILIAPDWDMPFELMCDASNLSIGAVLGKRQDKHFRPIHYASNTMTVTESNYTITEKEMLALVYAFEKFWSYLIMNKSIVYTDHSALKYPFAKKDSKARLLHHLSRLENPHQNVLDPKEINESFHLETLNLISTHGNSSTSRFPDFANYHAGNFVVKGMSSQQKSKFYTNSGTTPFCLKTVMIKSSEGVYQARKPLKFLRLATMDLLGDTMAQITLPRRIETMEEGTKILATVDDILRTVTESSLRRNLKLKDDLSFSGRIVSFFNTMLVPQGEGSSTPTEPHHTPYPKAQQTSPTTHSSPTLPSVTTAPIPTVTPSDTPHLRQYTRKARMAQSSALPPVAYEPASPLRDVIQGEACPTDYGFEADQDRENIAKTSTLPHESTLKSEMVTKFEAQELEINSLKAIIKLLEDKDKGVADQSGDDAPIKGRMDEGEEAAKRVMVPTAAEVTTATVSIPTGSGVVSTASLSIPTAAPIFTTATESTPYSRRKEKLAREDQRMSEHIARDAEVARIHAEEELQMMIDGKSRTKKQKSEYYMTVIKGHSGWKTKDFKGMSFEEIKTKFTTVWKQIEDFIPMGSKEERERFKRKRIRFEQESAKKLKTSEEVPEEVKSPDEVPEEKVKEMMQLVPIEEVYVEALQVKHPIIDWKVHTEGQRSYWKITMLRGSSAMKESLSIRPPTSDKEMELWVELKRLYEPYDEYQLWTHTQNLMHALVEWKLYDTCGVHHVTSKDKEIFMLVEKDYPLRKGLAIGLIRYKLQVENYSKMANDLILKIYKIASSPRHQDTVKDMTMKFGKLDKFERNNFRRPQKKMHFLLTTLKVVHVLSTLMPKFVEDETLEQTRKRCKWENDDYICHGHILNDTVKDMTMKFGKLDKFERNNFRRPQKKMHFLLTTLKVVHVLSTLMPKFMEDETLEQTKKRCKWENDDYICHRHILNGMSDALFNVYQTVGSA